MERLEKINNDFATLFREGQRLLQEGCGDVMNRHREEAFQRFEALGGIPYKTEDYLYADTLPVFDRDYRVVLKYIKQEVEVGESGYQSDFDDQRLVRAGECNAGNT